MPRATGVDPAMPVDRRGVSRSERLRGALDALYDAAGDASSLTTAIAQTTDALGATAANLFVRPGRIAAVPLLAMPFRIAPENVELYKAHYWRQDVWAHGCDARALERGAVVTGAQIVNEKADLLRGEFYAAVLQPDRLRHLITGVADRSAEHIIHISMFRGPDRPAFDTQARATMRAVLPALRVAVRATLQLELWRTRAHALEHALDAVPEPLFLLNEARVVVSMNPAAEAYLRTQSDVTCTRGRLGATNSHVARSIDAMLRAALTPGAAVDDVVVPGSSGLPTHRLRVVPLQPSSRVRSIGHDPRCAALAVFVTTRTARLPAQAEALTRVFGLTPKECLVAAQLVRGATLQRASEALGITYGTARGHLKQVFAKTGTHRQAELVSVLLSITASEPGGD